jgi:histidyl-tRNA synthetase
MGFGLGVERLLLAADAEGAFAAPTSVVDVWVVDTTGGRLATELADKLRAAGVSADHSFDARSMKAQVRAADRAGARLAVIVGEREQARGVAAIKDLSSGEQDEVALEFVVKHVAERLT